MNLVAEFGFLVLFENAFKWDQLAFNNLAGWTAQTDLL